MLAIFLLVIGLLSLFYYIKLIRYQIMSFSSFFLFIGIGCLIYWGIYFFYGISLYHYLPYYIRFLLYLAIFIFIIIEALIIYHGRKNDIKNVDYIVVLGAGLNGDKITTSLYHRLMATLRYHQYFPEIGIIVTGGQGRHECTTEARAMADFLIEHGVDASMIILEDKSKSTYENFSNTKEILNGSDYDICVISNHFHMYRAKYIGKYFGFRCYGYPAMDYMVSSVNYYVREFFGVVYAFIKLRK